MNTDNFIILSQTKCIFKTAGEDEKRTNVCEVLPKCFLPPYNRFEYNGHFLKPLKVHSLVNKLYIYLFIYLFTLKSVLENNDAEGVLPCLFKHKYEKKMDSKCRAELDHRELVSCYSQYFFTVYKQTPQQIRIYFENSKGN